LANPSHDWSLNVSFFDKKSVEMSEKLGRGYIDKKLVFISSSNKTALDIALDISRNSSIWICELQKGFLSYPSSMGDLISEASVYLFDKPYEDAKNSETFRFDREKGKLLNLTLISDVSKSNIPKGDHICFKTGIVSKGRYVLSVWQKALKSVSISYVVYW